jgi:AcrR family transcriptional regulator
VTSRVSPPRAGGRPRDPRSDAALIEAVLDLIGAGATLSGLSFVEIANQAGVSRNSLYRRWKTRDALYLDVLDSISRPLPRLTHRSAKQDLADLVSILVERTLDPRASKMLRSLNAEADTFPQLHQRYFADVVAPRRRAIVDALQRGIDAGEIRADVDLTLAAELLVAPILARMASGAIGDLDPTTTSQRIIELVFTGIQPPTQTALMG